MWNSFAILVDYRQCIVDGIKFTFKLCVLSFPLVISVVSDYGRPESIQTETEWEHTV